MIVYNSHETKTLMRISGSVLPAALKWAASAGVTAFILKFMQNSVIPDGIFGDLDISPAAYSGFSFTLGFVIVFRTSQCYNRFWTCATHVNAMRAEWYEAASALTTFITMSQKSLEEQNLFCHKVIRYFSLLHSLALQRLVDGEEAFPVIDLESLPEESLRLVLNTGSDDEGMSARVELVYQWIQALIVTSMSSGLLNVPPPILTRVLQQMTSGMVNYNSVLDIISIPFPFPYAQVTFVLLTFYVCFVPIVMCLLVNEAWIACICGFLSVLCLISVDLVSTEIENPFGHDANDLPCHEFQNKMNRALMNLIHPAASDPPELCSNAKLTFEELLAVQDSFTICNIDAPTFHGGKLKTVQPKPVDLKVIPVAKKREPKPPAPGSDSGNSGGPENPVAQSLVMQQGTMLAEFVQSNAAVLERMDRTLNTLTMALTQQLSNLPERQTRQVLESMPETETPARSVPRSLAGEEIAPCSPLSYLLSLPASGPGVPGRAPDQSARIIAQSQVVVQPRRS